MSSRSIRSIAAAALAAATALAVPATSPAATGRYETAAFKKGAAKFAKLHDAKASRISVTCEKTTKVGQTHRCRGSFRVTKGGKSATYRLTEKAGVFRNTPKSYEYHVYAKTTKKLADVPKSTSLLGFYQRGDGLG